MSVRRSRVAGPAALLVGVAALLAGCGGGSHDVVVSRSAAGHLALHPGGTGVVLPAVDLPLVVGYPGTVTHVDVTLGEKVTAGQPLLGINSEALSAAATQLSTHLALDQATLRTVRAQGTASADRISALQAQVALDGRLLDAAQGRTAQLSAPISGVVAAIDATAGSAFKATEPLVTIIDPAKVKVTFPVPVTYFGQVRTGMKAQLTGLGAAGTELPGQVVGVAPQTLPDGQSFSVVVSAVNAGGVAQPGRQAFVRLDLVTDVPVAVNKLAVLNQNTQPQLFVIQDGVAHQRSVVVGLQDDSTVQIISGLKAGEDVAIAGVQSLTDESRVTVSKSVPGS